MLVDAVPDHVAAVVPDVTAAHARWRDRLGAGDRAGDGPFIGFTNWQYRFAGGGILELLQGAGEESADFTRSFLDRFGPAIHHVTIKVPDLRDVLDDLAAAGIQLVDVDVSDERWRESFVRPSQVGGMIVQVASSTLDDDAWSALTGFRMTDPRPDGARLLGPLLEHPDLDHVRWLWSALGADVAEVDEDTVEATWAAGITVRTRRGGAARPVGLRVAGAPALPQDPVLGPAVLPA